MTTVVHPDVATWRGGGDPVLRHTMSIDSPAKAQTWRLLGYLTDGGDLVDNPAGVGVWVLDEELPVLCGCSHPSTDHAEDGAGWCEATEACGCAWFHLPMSHLRRGDGFRR